MFRSILMRKTSQMGYNQKHSTCKHQNGKGSNGRDWTQKF